MEPIENVTRWSRWAISGPESTISQVFSVLDANLPTGWKPLKGQDLLPYASLVKQGSHWYATDTTPSDAGVTLSIERPRETELQGGLVWFADPPAPSDKSSSPVGWDQVTRFLDDAIVPAARTAGANIRVPSPEDAFFSDLPVDVRDRLRTFSETARKSLPLSREETELWQDFVITAFRTKTVVDTRQFIGWLVTAGWSRESAAELDVQFSDHCDLLSRYTDEVSVA